LSVTIRYYLFPEEGEPRRLSQRLVEGLVSGSDFMPEFANSRQKVLAAVLDNQDGKPERMLSSEASIWIFDDNGAIDEGLRDAVFEIMNTLPTFGSSDGTVVPIGPRLNKKRLAAKYRWTPTQSDLNLVIADIWPNGQSARLKSAKGAAPRRPPITYDAKHALKETSDPFWRIEAAIRDLKEPSLVGFAFEAKRLSGEKDYSPLYRALGEMAEARLEILRRRRSGKGTWYAFVEVMHWDTDSTARTIATYHERCEGKKAAVKAARRLLAEHADKFSDDITVEAGVETDLEWAEADRFSA
jgi:hypothetical protein